MKNNLNFEDAHHFTLANGLRVMLCPQPDSDTSYVSMSVRAGHFYDPNECQGLAHLLEHMLFMGSRQFSKPNAINNYIEKHGGSINAWTGTEYANYHYHCNGDAVIQTLPAFANMLRQPILDEDALINEIRSIDAEFKFKKKDDLRRLYQIHKETCNPAHPFSKFSVGNDAIFSKFTVPELREALKQLHSTYYCANNMCLCIASPVPPEQLEALITQAFGGLPAGQLAKDDWPPLYTKQQLGIQINIKPLQTARRMIVTFALPGIHNDFETKPLNYISHLLGDEGKGSLLAYLKQKNWALNLIAGSGIEGDKFKDFNISFQLTEQGLAQYHEVLLALFSYLNLIKGALEERWRYEEKAQLTALALNYEENVKPLNLISEYAQHLFLFTPHQLNRLRTTIGSFDVHKLSEALSFFNANNLRLKVIAPDVYTDKSCAFYDAHYSVAPLSVGLLEKCMRPPVIDALSLPPPNPYLGSEYHLVMPEMGYDKPTKLHDDNGMRVCFAQDHQFRSPKGDIYISFDMQAFTNTIEAVAAKRIWLSALNDHLQAKYYRAEIAGLHYRIYGHQAGFTIHTRGFTDQQTLLAEQLLQTVMDFIPSLESFNHYKALQIQGLQNSLLNKPTNRLFSRLSVLIQRNTHAPIELLDAVSSASYAQMLDARERAFKEYYVDSFMHGNWSLDNAQTFTERLRKHCINTTGMPLSRAVSKLLPGEALYHHVHCEHEDAAVVLYLQAPTAQLFDTALCMVLEQMLAAPFFNALRTEQQLGYIVGTGYVPHNQHPGMAFYVQSPTASAKNLLEAMTAFLFQQLDEIEFYRFYWPTIKQNMLKQLEERDLSLSMKSQRLWVALGTQDLAFNRNTQLAECIENLAFEDIQQYAQRLAKREHCGELILHASGSFAPLDSPSDRTVESISAFKEQVPYY